MLIRAVANAGLEPEGYVTGGKELRARARARARARVRVRRIRLRQGLC